MFDPSGNSGDATYQVNSEGVAVLVLLGVVPVCAVLALLLLRHCLPDWLVLCTCAHGTRAPVPVLTALSSVVLTVAALATNEWVRVHLYNENERTYDVGLTQVFPFVVS